MVDKADEEEEGMVEEEVEEEEAKMTQLELEKELGSLVEAEVDDKILVSIEYEDRMIYVRGEVKDPYKDEFEKSPKVEVEGMVFECEEEKKQVLENLIDYYKGEREELKEKEEEFKEIIDGFLKNVREAREEEMLTAEEDIEKAINKWIESTPGGEAPKKNRKLKGELMKKFVEEQEEKKSIEEGLCIHHTEGAHEEIHSIVAMLMGTTPDKLYDPKHRSDMPEYKYKICFDLMRDKLETEGEEPYPWTAAGGRITPSDLFEALEKSEVEEDEYTIVTKGKPLA